MKCKTAINQQEPMSVELILSCLICSYGITDPALVCMSETLGRLLRQEPITDKDVANITQSFELDPMMSTFELQTLVDWINEKYHRNYKLGKGYEVTEERQCVGVHDREAPVLQVSRHGILGCVFEWCQRQKHHHQ